MIKRLVTVYVFISFLHLTCFSQVKILFDATKAESAGNADWVIDASVHNLGYSSGLPVVGQGVESNPGRYPTTTAESSITNSSPETAWEGSLSSWGIDLVKRGYAVETVPYNGKITYGDNTNAQDLSNYKVFIIDEPNILFTSTEETALLNFVRNGGGLFMISDHAGSDRNNDGYDSPTVWNDFMTYSNNVFGITWANNNFSQTSSNFATLPNDSLLHGPYGNPVKLQYSNGSSIKINPSLNSSVVGVVYVNGCSTTGDTGVMMCHARYGSGKVVATGDSSPMDDGTGDPNDNLYNGWTGDANGNHELLIMNATIWLAESDPVVTDPVHLITATDTTICSGSSITMTAAGATTYLWQPGGATSASITVQPSASGLYIVTGYFGGVSKQDTVHVTVDAFSGTTPQISAGGPLTLCGSNSVTLTAPSESGYQWSNSSSQRSITVTQAGSYMVTLTDANGCRATSNTVNVAADNFSATTPQMTAGGPLTFCGGASVTLTVPSESGYAWSSGQTTAGITVSQTGAFVATLTDANGCHATTNTVNVTADTFSLSHPQITANGPLSFCTGSNVVLSAPAANTYQWNNSSTQQTITVSQSGLFYATVTDGNNCAAQSDTAVVNVSSGDLNGVQITPAGPQTVCTGSSVTLSAPSGYTAYLWSNGSTQQSISVSQQGNYYATVTISGDCHGSSDTVSVSIDNFSTTTPQISAGGSLTFCQGDSVTLSASGGESYNWSNSSQQSSITVTQTGTYQATVTNANQCSAVSQSLSVTVNAAPTISFAISPDSVCTNSGSVLLNATPAGGTYQGIGLSGSNFDPSAAGAGTFEISYTANSNGCSSEDSSRITVYICAGIETINADDISVYPNPSTGEFMFQTSAGSAPEAVRVYDDMGRQVMEISNLTGGVNVVKLNLVGFANGVYIAEFSRNNTVIKKKLVKGE